MSKKAVLLINLGSPDSTSVPDVRRYLAEFLGDERVIDVPFARKVIIPGIVLRTRPKQTAEAYKAVWTEEGSPLVVTSIQQQKKLQALTELPIELAMRYGNPSIPSILESLVKDGVEHIFLVPLYPHYAMSSYETVVVRVMEVAKQIALHLRIDTLQPFYNDPDYIDILADSMRPYVEAPFDQLLFSYHGIPERQVKKSDPSHAHCLCTTDCCNIANPAHATCYRHQCLTMTRLVVEKLGLSNDQWSVSFQSRLLNDPWLRPFTDETLKEMPSQGVKRLRVVCPSFITDCLETLEEIAVEGKEIFLANGGTDYELIPCLNENPAWIEYLKNRVDLWNETGSVSHS